MHEHPLSGRKSRVNELARFIENGKDIFLLVVVFREVQVGNSGFFVLVSDMQWEIDFLEGNDLGYVFAG